MGDICVPAGLSLKHVVVETEHAFAVEAYFSNDRSMIAVQRAFHSYFNIPSRGHVLNRKCVSMWMDAFRAAKNVSKERKDPPKTVRTLKLWNEIVFQFKPVCDNDPTILTRSQRKILTTYEYRRMPKSKPPGFHGCFKNSRLRVTNIHERERKLSCALT
ncbi:hypothetical protein TNCV_4075041 [Trichonephila clavipes]|nr:hypothetical protein TNCV_4075041 [Trichonephila clavipes]